jgi:hypothetical protein
MHLVNHPKVFGLEVTLFYSSFVLRSLFLSCAIQHPILITEILLNNRNGLAFRKVFGAVPSTEKKLQPVISLRYYEQ